MIIIMKSG